MIFAVNAWDGRSQIAARTGGFYAMPTILVH